MPNRLGIARVLRRKAAHLLAIDDCEHMTNGFFSSLFLLRKLK
ncbi:hypothetical protein A33K_13167 [Burkholderia humptydooensis MSMB43]|uniref:Uncharacterized protein n=1 Tax=Burkholderia humptydooensis MSMB43 TaxID=441157 RepID=A0ABN0GC11_9BURK|nr:hypothetical protein A33K_13167 [Burkholderia humptydooensis MSMB43]